MKKNVSKISTPGEGKLKGMLDLASFMFTRPGWGLLKRVAKKALYRLGLLEEKQVDYSEWIEKTLDPVVIKKEFDAKYPQLSSKPVISVITSITEPELQNIRSSVDSVIGQLYPHWELVIINNFRGNGEVDRLMAGYTSNDRRIKISPIGQSNTAAANYNEALSIATGSHVLFINQQDVLTTNCLFEAAQYINNYHLCMLVYFDEDEVDQAGKFMNPYFKPGWSPDTLLSRNYIGDCFVVKRELVSSYFPMREGFEGAEIFDSMLRALEYTALTGHIPQVLLHRRVNGSSRKNTPGIKKGLEEAMGRRKRPAVVSEVQGHPGYFNIAYDIPSYEKVSIIIPTKDQAELLKTTIESILNKTTYPDYEIIVLNNNSTTPEFFELIRGYETRLPGKFKCIEAGFPFNFSRLINLGVSACKGKYVLMLNNDVEVITADWMTKMVSYAQHEGTGAVGAKLLYPDDTIQHAGIVLGINGDAGHAFINSPKDEVGYHGCLITATNYAAVTGACLMCRKELLEDVGGMSELLEVEYNDLDLCLKFFTQGYYNVFLPDVVLYHYESATRGHPFRSRKSWAQHEKELTLFKSKWQEYIDADPFYNPNLSLLHTDFRMK